ncbi:Rv3654c family TadE-like protein [Subtercola lobariae]|uniref:Uncharacterized protein n=1 Tax=Subtercola lobariae TaxID=1588641 RepID=A0A917EW03_9MICO|nr:Rv3654c family TadE-like protein [Subtercola lobariae]GGF13280.1 hypothetical protein GCM10011399_03980 [Subtercola lobariae]
MRTFTSRAPTGWDERALVLETRGSLFRHRSLFRDDRGSGSVLALALIGAVLGVTALLLTLAAALGVKHTVESTAESAALAAADVASGSVGGYPCDRAATAAALGGASLDSCDVVGAIVTVRVSRSVLGFEVGALARAGPPPENGLDTPPP